MGSREVAEHVGPAQGCASARNDGRSVGRIEFVPRDNGVIFRCEACQTELHDLRGVFLAYRGTSGWRIECSQHGDAEHVMDGGHLFGGGLRSLELFGELARARWFDAADLFRTLLRLRAQTVGLYRSPEDPEASSS